MAKLLVIQGVDQGRQFDVPDGEPSTIGRDRSNRVVLHDTEVSRRHAELFFVRSEPRIRDVGSVNGTMVNGKTIKESPLEPGDHLTLGQTTFVFSSTRTDRPGTMTDLTQQVRMVQSSKQESDRPSAIVKTVGEDEGSRILAKPDDLGTPWLKAKLASLSVMYETTQAVSHILDLDQLLDRILELIFNSIPADHGCVMVRSGESGEYEPKAIRFRLPGGPGQMTVSRTIMDFVLRERQGVLLSDAARDDRFAAGNSITRFNIREVICVPMKGRHETHGVLFLDTVTGTKQLAASGKDNVESRLTEEHLALAIAIAHQAGLAIEETRYHQAMLHGERLAAIGQTIAALSHHIKNIMQGIMFGSDMVRTGIADKDDTLLNKGWRLVEKNQGKIHDLVLDMLSFSKEREPAIEMIDLNAVVEDAVDVVDPRAKDSGVLIELHFATNLPKVPADPDGVHRAVLNIISNAVDALEGAESKYVGVQTKLEPSGEWVRIVILDHGPGIPADRLGDIFRPFVSTKGSRGTGLGLPVSRKIFREHGGDVTVESKPGKGSKFILRLPLKVPGAGDMSSGTLEMKALPAEEV